MRGCFESEEYGVLFRSHFRAARLPPEFGEQFHGGLGVIEFEGRRILAVRSGAHFAPRSPIDRDGNVRAGNGPIG